MMLNELRKNRATVQVVRSANLTNAADAFARQLRDWAYQCVDDLGVDYVGTHHDRGGHDQATFTTGWEPIIQHSTEPRLIEYMARVRDQIFKTMTAEDRWSHGYWRMQEAHHGTEHFELFLGTLWRLAPGDERTVLHIDDACEHVGNWSPDVPPWFDYETGLFRSLYFGTDGTRAGPGMDINLPDHFRCVNLCLLAFNATGQARYRDLAEVHAMNWARAISSGLLIPLALHAQGPVFDFTDEHRRAKTGIGMSLPTEDTLDRAENFLASGAINALLTLSMLTARDEFLLAARHLLDALAPAVADPDAGVVADILRTYRRQTGESRYDRFVLQAVDRDAAMGVREVSVEDVTDRAARPSGAGKRKDAPLWFEDSQPRRHHPVTLAALAEITNDEALATKAIDLASAYLTLARRIFPHGHGHGCSARSVSAVARGHGRENNAGMATGVYAPLARHFDF